MRKIVFLFLMLSAIYFLNGCRKNQDEGSNVISRENIQGRWSLVSEQVHSVYSHGEVTDTTIFFRYNYLEINSTDTCEIFSGGGTFSFAMSYLPPDTLIFSSCPVGFYCDPIIYLIAYKIIDFNSNEKMVMENKKNTYDYYNESLILTITRTRHYKRI